MRFDRRTAAILVMAVGLCVAGCAPNVRPTPLETPPCPELPAPPEDDSADSWAIWVSDVVRMYGDCALRK